MSSSGRAVVCMEMDTPLEGGERRLRSPADSAWGGLKVAATPVGVISGSLDGTILIADPASGRILHRITVHSQGLPPPLS